MKFDNLLGGLAAIDVKVDEEDQICHLLSSLPKEFEHVITSIETMATEKQLNLELVKTRLLDAETKLKLNNDTDTQNEINNAFIIKCYGCEKTEHKSFECRAKGRRGTSFQRNRGYRNGRRGRGQGHSSWHDGAQATYAEVDNEFCFLMNTNAMVEEVNTNNI
ncbi:hypothetical protein evm_003122 [Chilo suppressalis]|nr:hypothetical protein evm_003122 [Chilo suppressalis]